ncbi:hypothetical protein FGRMN_2949 [Fusarium graminum]|nr:hypothetical protein FGRMN_2949 [Fusarium graminum]
MCLMLTAFTCYPVAKYWDDSQPGKRLDNRALCYAFAGINIINDIVLLLAPMPFLKNLQTERRIKFILLEFSRLVELPASSQSSDCIRPGRTVLCLYLNGQGTDIAMWSSLECNIAIICACVPSLKPLFSRVFPSFVVSPQKVKTNPTGDHYARGSLHVYNNIPNYPYGRLRSVQCMNRRFSAQQSFEMNTATTSNNNNSEKYLVTGAMARYQGSAGSRSSHLVKDRVLFSLVKHRMSSDQTDDMYLFNHDWWERNGSPNGDDFQEAADAPNNHQTWDQHHHRIRDFYRRATNVPYHEVASRKRKLEEPFPNRKLHHAANGALTAACSDWLPSTKGDYPELTPLRTGKRTYIRPQAEQNAPDNSMVGFLPRTHELSINVPYETRPESVLPTESDFSLESRSLSGKGSPTPLSSSTIKPSPIAFAKRPSLDDGITYKHGAPSPSPFLYRELSTVEVLRQEKVLWSNHIWECVQSLNVPQDWKVFDPGFPFYNEHHTSNRNRIASSPRNLVFFCHRKCHWSLCHVDTQSDKICHYNSAKDVQMPLRSLQNWLKANKIGLDMSIDEKECPQQRDGTNCGLYALVFLKALLDNQEMPQEVDTVLERSYFAEMVDRNATKQNYVQTGLAPSHTPAWSALKTSAPRSPRQAILLEDTPFPDVFSNSPTHRDLPPWPYSLDHASNKSELLPPALPNPPATPPLDNSPDIGVAAQNAQHSFENFLFSCQQIKKGVKTMKKDLIERTDYLESAKKDLESQQSELDIKEQKLKEMAERSVDWQSVLASDLQARQWLATQPHPVDNSGLEWMHELVAFANAKRLDMYTNAVSRITGAKELQESILATTTKVKRLVDDVSAREESIRELREAIDTNVSKLKSLEHMCTTAFDGGDSCTSNGEGNGIL